ncbi:sulfurtransferase TusA family protein [Thermogymnomonas acidicola]|uniref:sulfurtransferase TusA family protein n=1 Tax=Thermogymnomonas acidicola TaxID=399579 RepID=UPI0009466FDD|nr:sulfurtransferase TusA family protein [Thermogymnomonas acidicola]
MEYPSVSHVLDLRGMECPAPLREFVRRVTPLPAGTVVSALVTDPGAEIDIRSWSIKTGNRVLGVAHGDGYREIIVEKVR